eukprot:CAMPEP_0204545178 /NCGR_PEP_ID=MMETSP0661-20131031/21080_1 /ASSEMBLY_ACC=CAM_ASM_000606 /TAXON_ID=109239 /ORGANISM="Alexandrium margalefi, Strain AMGDE01CS-322" /LENGTH=225 /DNA_ID=CAMNT_0051551965 /DNA_START=41 /DNA_END=715 /DNA_ORIENTATION=+
MAARLAQPSGPQHPEATSPLSPDLKAPWAARLGTQPAEATPSTSSGASGTPPSLGPCKEIAEEEVTEMRKYVRLLVEELGRDEDQPEEQEEEHEEGLDSLDELGLVACTPAGRPSPLARGTQPLSTPALAAVAESPPSPTKPQRRPLAAGRRGLRDRASSKDSLLSTMHIVRSRSKDSLVSGTSATSTLSHTVCRLSFSEQGGLDAGHAASPKALEAAAPRGGKE